MDLKCPRCDYVARADDEAEARRKLNDHMKIAHQLKGGEEGMLEGMKQKITGMFKR